MEITIPDRPERRAQIGVETLIVFIAMVLVAAIAATLLLNTAGFLQNQASTTAQDAQDQVSNQVLIISSVGEISEDGGDNAIGEVRVSVMQSPGAGEIDLGGSSVEYVGPDGQETLIYDESPDVGEFGVEDVRNGDTVPVLTERQDRYVISVELTDDDTSDLRYLEPGESATLRIVTPAGSEAVEILNVPQSLSSYDEGDAVQL
ncbi:archaellin/type IV pilin N-terminal domain-containing protein [Natranaeroarchaeum sulfidigenes]|uniref:Flagellin n=1 Tax=Natranaeroarchaeum sulfidigenes TaxID=2784880 RepID=A0A897MSY7_9EURY|nr:archaellin/type IV pilin N-terminal domain-containing protein [Natranaeroarchaeum sulfidigenes]QSG03607.1 Archaeal flagellin [Natranaeroarchaeum sulfidigenes]